MKTIYYLQGLGVWTTRHNDRMRYAAVGTTIDGVKVHSIISTTMNDRNTIRALSARIIEL